MNHKNTRNLLMILKSVHDSCQANSLILKFIFVIIFLEIDEEIRIWVFFRPLDFYSNVLGVVVEKKVTHHAQNEVKGTCDQASDNLKV